jgi:hypothetical protein
MEANISSNGNKSVLNYIMGSYVIIAINAI